MTPVLALSPHLDDAVFSAGGTLARLAAAGARVMVATVFTATVTEPRGFALACQLDKGLGPEVDYMALRRAEDVAACAAVGSGARHLPFAEAPHRGYGSSAELFAGVRPDDDVAAPVASALARLMEEIRPALVLAPQAVGAHVDHVALVRALDALATTTPVAWWRDHPYTIRTDRPAEPFAARFADLGVLEVRLPAAAHLAKVRGALAYPSQLGFQFGGVEAARRVFEDAEPVELWQADAAARATLAGLLADAYGG